MLEKPVLKPVVILTLILFAGLGLSRSFAIAEKGKPQRVDDGTRLVPSAVDQIENPPGSMEIEDQNVVATRPRAKKKIPWILAGTGIVAAGIVVYLLFIRNSKHKDKALMINGVRYDMVAIPAGEFQMGANDRGYDERPLHSVRVSRHFWLGKTEVTQGLWKAVMGDNPSYFQKGDRYPVEMVSWADCQVFISKLNQLVGEGRFRLPTEAEWEYACRAGTTGDSYGNIDEIAWYVENSAGSTRPVGQKQANAFGLHDMLGNVCEQCQDWYGPYSGGYQKDPTGPATGLLRTARGGSWNLIPTCVRSSIRRWVDPNGYNYILGLRLATSSASGW